MTIQIGEGCATPEDLANLLEQVAAQLRRPEVGQRLDQHGVVQSIYPLWTVTADDRAPSYPRT